jgi:3-hydroxyisobutyrate dehydrogenase
MDVGLIGTGNMGGRFGLKILAAGHKLTVNDLRQEAAANLCEAGAIWADSPAAVARRSSVVLTSLPSPAAVEEVVLNPSNGILANLAPSGVYIDHSTSTPWLARRIAEACKNLGLSSLDAPLSSGGRFIGVGGDRTAFESCLPVLEAVGGEVFYVGDAGMGQVTKLVRQYVGFCSFAVHMEAMMIYEKAGGDVAMIADFIKKSTGSDGGGHERYISRLLNRDFGTPEASTATLDIVSKDVDLSVQLARSVGSPASIGLVVSDLLKRGQEMGWGRNEHWSAVHALEAAAGAELGGSTRRERDS